MMVIVSPGPTAAKQGLKPTGKNSAARVSEQGNYVGLLAGELCGWHDPRERVADVIHRGCFVLFAQDIVSLVSNGMYVLGREILVRMREEEDMLLPPGAFLPVLEHFNLMPALDAWVIRDLARRHEQNRIPENGIDFVNISSRTLSDAAFRDALREEIDLSRLVPKHLCLEIDEVDAATLTTESTAFVEAMKARGCRIAIDHFGKGKVSFDLLKRLRVDFVKLDAGLIINLLKNPVALATVRAIQRICGTIGVETIAQSVESSESARHLQVLGVGHAQGFFYSAPRCVELGPAPAGAQL